ncbi:hypothetical protein [Cupriavidus pampae]|uniref:Uncharacterized protein n=1 Tax=Cupriavidus pampae TaxID=659251 RepID=A0ABN7ZGC5_9BURK|nr:hypothetical protein [Cupriavidus pampae]CAG9184488.1 hypothetical protein LMG32289_05637 [Cupriavidus pampae]
MTSPIYYGSIHADESQRAMLESFGVSLGTYNDATQTFPARTSAEGLARLAEFCNDFPLTMHQRPVDAQDMQLRAGMTEEHVRAEAAFVTYHLSGAPVVQRRRWRGAASAIEAVIQSLTSTDGQKPATVDGRRLGELAQAMGVALQRGLTAQDGSWDNYVLDWAEAQSASDEADQTQNRELATFIARMQQDIQNDSALTDASRVDALEMRQIAFANAVSTAKAADFERCGRDIAARLAVGRKPDAVLLTSAMVREWIELEQREFLALEDTLRRGEAACLIEAIMTDNPDFCALFNHAHPAVSAIIASHAESQAYRVLEKEARKAGEQHGARPTLRPFAEYTVLTHTGGDRRHVAVFSDPMQAVLAFKDAPATARPYLLANGHMVFYRDPERDRITLTKTCRDSFQQMDLQRKDESDTSLSKTLQEGLRRTDVVIYSPTDGVFLGECLGVAFWSNLETADQPSAAAFPSVTHALQFMSTWQTPPPSDIQYVWVEPDVGGTHASIAACVRAGLPAWDISQIAHEDAAPAVH